MRRTTMIAALGVFALIAGGCQPAAENEAADEMNAETADAGAVEEGDDEGAMEHDPVASTGEPTAVARLQPADGSDVGGTVTFTQQADGVLVVANVTGLTGAEHGFHIHETGECTAPFESAGGHLDPYDYPHGCAPEDQRELGDIGNLEVGDDGTGTYHAVLDKISLVDPAHQIAGRSVIVHAGADDCSTQPTGESGDRIACGVIEMVQ